MSSALRWVRAKLKIAFDGQIDEHAVESQPVSALVPVLLFMELLAAAILASVYYATATTTNTVIGAYDPSSIVVPTSLQPVAVSLISTESVSILGRVNTVVDLYVDGTVIVPTPDWCDALAARTFFTSEYLTSQPTVSFIPVTSTRYRYKSPSPVHSFIPCYHEYSVQVGGLTFLFHFAPDIRPPNQYPPAAGEAHICPTFGTPNLTVYAQDGFPGVSCQTERGGQIATVPLTDRDRVLNVTAAMAEGEPLFDNLCWGELMALYVPPALISQFVGSCRAAYGTSTLYFNTVDTRHPVLEILSLTFSAVALVYSVTLFLLRELVMRWKQQRAAKQLSPSQRSEHEMITTVHMAPVNPNSVMPHVASAEPSDS